jgi:quinol monooxygenase YgiN
MTAFNVVRFRVKPGQEKAFIDHHKKAELNAKGFRKGALIRTGDRSYCMIGEWNDMDDLAAARPAMIGVLDGMRHMLEDLGGGLGVTDPVSGTAVVEMKG